VRGGELEALRSLSVPESLGLFYLSVIRYLGYDLFDEYKVMGLAPYGDPAVYREALQAAYKLLPEGRWSICEDRLVEALNAYPARRKGAPFTEQHQDLAAALQEALETLAFHLIGYFRETTGHRNLALAGGVSLNCTMTGKLLESGLFDGVFVQPASHDGGCALGAALYEWSRLNPIDLLDLHVEHVYWGSEVGPEDAILNELQRWERLVRTERMDDVISSTAKMLAGDAVVGWVQGRSEYGPRALGNRSILADPRPAANKDRINRMIKKRESYRPFAPSVLEEELHSIFEISDHADVLRFMGFTAQVRPELRASLGAITHVDGSARLQTVSRKTNPKYWELIDAFRQETGIPLLLNTSFNNNAEPIVDSVRDAVVCYLTTGLDMLIVDNFLITRRDDVFEEAFLAFSAWLPEHHFVREVFERDADGRRISAVEIASSYDERRCQRISRRMREFLFSDTSAALPDEMSPDDRKTFVIELRELWSERWIRLNDPSEERISRL
jgi:carbamoyltransferase